MSDRPTHSSPPAPNSKGLIAISQPSPEEQEVPGLLPLTIGHYSRTMIHEGEKNPKSTRHHTKGDPFPEEAQREGIPFSGTGRSY